MVAGHRSAHTGRAMATPEDRPGPDAGRPSDGQPPRPTADRGGAAASPARVVVVDDHAGVRLGVVRLIGASPGFAVVGEAADGEEAVRLVARVHADVVLMDVSMPVLDGVSATRRVAALPPSVRPAVVLFTAWADRERMAGAMAAGASGYVLKDAPP
ncbi:MAG: hypothetical protein V7605_2443, partial [Acidimicrobiaceae bacterium]